MAFNFLLQIQTTPEAGDKPADTSISVMDIMGQSNAGIGWLINLLLFAMFGYVIYVFVERYMALRRASREEADFLSRIKDYLKEGKIEEAKKFCVNSSSPSARMLEKGIDRLGKPMESISAAIENSAKLEVLRLEQGVSFLGTASGAGPMLGFLGTVVGMVVVFLDLQTANTIELDIIVPGIMTALITTVEGLIVGIVAYMGYNYLVERIGRIVYNMENAALEFMDLLNQPGK